MGGERGYVRCRAEFTSPVSTSMVCWVGVVAFEEDEDDRNAIVQFECYDSQDPLFLKMWIRVWRRGGFSGGTLIIISQCIRLGQDSSGVNKYGNWTQERDNH